MDRESFIKIGTKWRGRLFGLGGFAASSESRIANLKNRQPRPTGERS
jgi:hypothetical protein